MYLTHFYTLLCGRGIPSRLHMHTTLRTICLQDLGYMRMTKVDSVINGRAIPAIQQVDINVRQWQEILDTLHMPWATRTTQTTSREKGNTLHHGGPGPSKIQHKQPPAKLTHHRTHSLHQVLLCFFFLAIQSYNCSLSHTQYEIAYSVTLSSYVLEYNNPLRFAQETVSYALQCPVCTVQKVRSGSYKYTESYHQQRQHEGQTCRRSPPHLRPYR